MMKKKKTMSPGATGQITPPTRIYLGILMPSPEYTGGIFWTGYIPSWYTGSFSDLKSNSEEIN